MKNLFKATRSSVDLSKSFRLIRNGDWTSNGYWAMLTSMEPTFISELKTTSTSTDLKQVIEKYDQSKCKLVVPSDRLMITGLDTIVRLLEGEGIRTWVKPQYISLMHKISESGHFYAEDSLKPIFYLVNETIVGVVMPIRNAEDHETDIKTS